MELSVVVVLIGIIIGGVVTGVQLMRTAQVRAVVKEMDSIVKAVGIFKEKYNQLPGDMYNATNFWGTDAGCPGTPFNSNIKMVTCNGNGNGRIGYIDGLTTPDGTAYEMFRAWQHMAAAGLISQAFSGTSSSAVAVDEKAGVHNFASSLQGAGWTIGYLEAPTTTNDYYGALYGNRLSFGRPKVIGGTNSWMAGPALSTEEAYAIDSKVDDGKPSQGKVLSYRLDSMIAPMCARWIMGIGNLEEESFYDVANKDDGICALLAITGY